MPFEIAAPSVVRSIVQRDLLNAWIRLRNQYGGFVPQQEFAPPRLDEERKDMIDYRVRCDPEGWQFIIQSKGSSAARAYGTAASDNRGTSLHDYLAPEMRPLVLPLYDECASRGLPVYSTSALEDVNGTKVVYERLLLPFHEQGRVGRILASLKAIADDGKFEINNLMRKRDRLPEYALRAVIGTGLSGQAAKRDAMRRWNEAFASDDIIEI